MWCQKVLSQGIQKQGRKMKKLQIRLNTYIIINNNKPKQGLASAPAFFQAVHHTLFIGLLGRLSLAELGSAVLRNVSRRRMPGTTTLVGCHRKAGRGGTDKYQAGLCSFGTLYCPRNTWPPRCTYSLLLPPQKKKRQAVESISTAKLLNMNYSIFNHHYSAIILHSLIPKNLCNESLCGCQILAFNGAVPGSTRNP